jgi:lysyl-tRNA synthetase class 2
LAPNWRLASRKKALETRAATIDAIRSFFRESQYLEVETPFRIPAPAPESHIDAIPADGWFLHTSPELCMKRLLAAGYPRIFQISHCWREGERGTRHICEFTMLEWYRAGAEYNGLMDETQALVSSVVRKVTGRRTLTYQGQRIRLAGQWARLTVGDAYQRYSGISAEGALADGSFDERMVRDIEPMLGHPEPTFLYDYPASRGSLARLRADNPSVAERFELYIAGLELANGFSELVDPAEQRRRFEEEETYRRSMGKRPYPTAEKFLQELEDMPPSAGIALGVDRLVMLIHNTNSIDDVVAFTPEEL